MEHLVTIPTWLLGGHFGWLVVPFLLGIFGWGGGWGVDFMLSQPSAQTITTSTEG
jgi:hypothetical protein